MELSVFGEEPRNSELNRIIEKDLEPIPMRKFLIFLVIVAYTLVLVLFRGGEKFPSILGLTPCGFGTWVCVLLQFGISYWFAKYIGQTQYSLDQLKESLGYVYQNEEDKMS